jgi:hypothetical protein
MKCPLVSKMHVCDITFCRKVDGTCWDLIHQPSVQQFNALPTEPRGLAVDYCCLNAIFIAMQIRWHARLACIYGACQCMIAKSMNKNHLDSNMYQVLYFVDLIWYSFGRVLHFTHGAMLCKYKMYFIIGSKLSLLPLLINCHVRSYTNAGRGY